MDTQHIGKAEVINCEFEYECPLDWFNLDTTDDPNVRHCGECKKSVTFCENLVWCLKSNHQIMVLAARATDAKMVSALLCHTNGLGSSL